MALNTVQAIINGQTYTLTYNGTTGKYEATVTAPSTSSYNQSGHYYGVTVKATDVAGNITQKDSTDATLGAALKLTVKEKVAPTIAITSPGASAKLTNNRPPITFQLRDADSGVAISTLALKVDGGTAQGNAASGMTCTPVAGGYDCSYTPPSALTDGSHTVTINISDNDGNAATQASVSFTVDTVAPTLNVTAPAAGLITNDSTQDVVGTTSDATSSPVTVTITLNGVDQGTVTITAGAFTKPVTLAEGSNTIVITATDGAGKTTTISRTVTLDTIAPSITAVTITPNPVDAGATYLIQVSAAD